MAALTTARHSFSAGEAASIQRPCNQSVPFSAIKTWENSTPRLPVEPDQGFNEIPGMGTETDKGGFAKIALQGSRHEFLVGFWSL
jgi:hypothetical protein